jgi:hypothetical protein
MLTDKELYQLRSGSLEEANVILGKLRDQIVEQVLLSIPMAVVNLVNYSKTLKNSAEEFYRENPDLIEHKALVGKVLQVLESERPGDEIESLLSDAKEIVNERLRSLR